MLSGEPGRVNADAEGEAEPSESVSLSQERYAEMGAAEQFILTVSVNGYGKRTSSFEYRITRRGGIFTFASACSCASLRKPAITNSRAGRQCLAMRPDWRGPLIQGFENMVK